MLVQNATASQEKLAQAAQSSVTTITRLAEVVKLGAASLGSEDPETQVRTAATGGGQVCLGGSQLLCLILPSSLCPGGPDQRSQGRR